MGAKWEIALGSYLKFSLNLLQFFLGWVLGLVVVSYFWQVPQDCSPIGTTRCRYLPEFFDKPIRILFKVGGGGRSAKYVSWMWWKLGTDLRCYLVDQGVQNNAQKISPKNYVSLSCFLKETTLSFLTDAVDIFCLLLFPFPIIPLSQYSSHSCKYISSNINTISSEITPANIKDVVHFPASAYLSVVCFSRYKDGNGNSFINNRHVCN